MGNSNTFFIRFNLKATEVAIGMNSAESRF